jgi:dihydrodipicolinate synthase/N-acetylneuraminate lyase
MLVGKFSGVIAYTVTPFTDDGEVNVSVFANVIDKIIAAGKPRKPLKALSEENTSRLAQLLADLDE